MNKIPRAALVLAVAAVALLAGCASGPAAAPKSGSTAAVEPTPAPMRTRPAIAQLIVTPDGVAPLVAGQPVPNESAATAIVSYKPDACIDAGNDLKVGDPGAGAWIANYPDEDNPVGSRQPFEISTKDGLRDGDMACCGSGPRICEPWTASASGAVSRIWWRPTGIERSSITG